MEVYACACGVIQYIRLGLSFGFAMGCDSHSVIVIIVNAGMTSEFV